MSDIGCRGKSPYTRGAIDIFSQRLTFDIVHDDVDMGVFGLRGLGNLEIVYLHNVGMVERSDDACLAFKTSQKVGIILQISMKNSDSDKALQLGIVSLPEFGHATVPQTLTQFILSKTLCVCICTHGHPPPSMQVCRGIYF